MNLHCWTVRCQLSCWVGYPQHPSHSALTCYKVAYGQQANHHQNHNQRHRGYQPRLLQKRSCCNCNHRKEVIVKISTLVCWLTRKHQYETAETRDRDSLEYLIDALPPDRDLYKCRLGLWLHKIYLKYIYLGCCFI